MWDPLCQTRHLSTAEDGNLSKCFYVAQSEIVLGAMSFVIKYYRKNSDGREKTPRVFFRGNAFT